MQSSNERKSANLVATSPAITGRIVDVKRSVSNPKVSKQKYPLHLRVDFTNVTHEQLMGLAVNGAIIILQGHLRNDPRGMSAAIAALQGKLSVRAMLDMPRKPRGEADPVKRANNAVRTLNDEQLDAFLAEHGLQLSPKSKLAKVSKTS